MTDDAVPAGYSLIEREHDDECGCPEETWDTPYGVLNMHLSAGKPSNAVLDNGDAGEWSIDLTADTVDAARCAFFGWAAFVAYTPRAALSAAPRAPATEAGGKVWRIARFMGEQGEREAVIDWLRKVADSKPHGTDWRTYYEIADAIEVEKHIATPTDQVKDGKGGVA